MNFSSSAGEFAKIFFLEKIKRKKYANKNRKKKIPIGLIPLMINTLVAENVDPQTATINMAKTTNTQSRYGILCSLIKNMFFPICKISKISDI